MVTVSFAASGAPLVASTNAAARIDTRTARNLSACPVETAGPVRSRDRNPADDRGRNERTGTMADKTATGGPLPQITDRLTWQAKIDELRVKEKAHTRAGDALAAERRRLPMVEVDPQTPLIGADGRVTLIDLFAGRSQLI